MKKTILLLLLVTWSLFTYGKLVSVNDAKIVGYNQLLQQGLPPSVKSGDFSLVYTADEGRATFYVFSSAGSFVMVSADDAVEPILAYSTNRAFHGDNIPPHVASFIDGYSQQINYVIAHNGQATAEIAKQWENLAKNRKMGTGAKTTAVSPLMSTTWDQAPYYNANCPYDYSYSARTVTGCVATATAQVMKFWNWPAHGTGMHSYSAGSYGIQSANFGATTYNWASMPNSVVSSNPSVATLMHHVGVSVDMNYGPGATGGSSAYVISAASPVANCVEYALKTYFNYKPTLQGKKRADYTDAAWISLMKAELDASRPIVYAGFGSSGGHCFVADGYDASNKLHINWGWSGSGPDGFYNINSMNPPSLGTGGGGGGFNSGQQAVIGIEPNSTGSTATASISLYDYVSLSASTIGYYNSFSVNTNVINSGTTSFTGDFCAAAFDATTGAFITYVDSVMGTTLPSGYVFSFPGLDFSTSGLLAMLPGSYLIGVYYRVTGGSWVAVSNSGGYSNFEPMDVVNHNYMQLAAAMIPSPATFVQGSSASVSLKVRNTSGFGFSGDYDVSLYNLDGTLNTTIQTLSGMSLGAGATSGVLTFSMSSLTAAPGTYLLAMMFDDGSGYSLTGTDFFTNPIYVTVVEPAPLPDMYEANNTFSAAYNLPLTFSADVANKSTTGSNIHVTTDIDFYKIVLPAGYNYSISARVNDDLSSDDAASYSEDVVWSYTTDGTSWSPVYNDVMTGAISVGSLAGGTLTFKVAPAFPGQLGNYILKMNVTRSTLSSAVPGLSIAPVKVYPNPATNIIKIDLTETGVKDANVTLTDLQGKVVVRMAMNAGQLIEIPVSDQPAGIYMLKVSTDAGVFARKITISH